MKIVWWKKSEDWAWTSDYLVCLKTPEGMFIKVLIPADLCKPEGMEIVPFGLNLVSGGHYE